MISSVIGSPRVRVDLATQPYRGFADDHREAARPLQRNGKRAVGRLHYPGVTPPLGTRPSGARSEAPLPVRLDQLTTAGDKDQGIERNGNANCVRQWLTRCCLETRGGSAHCSARIAIARTSPNDAA